MSPFPAQTGEDGGGGRQLLYSATTIQAGEEITVSYLPDNLLQVHHTHSASASDGNIKLIYSSLPAPR